MGSPRSLRRRVGAICTAIVFVAIVASPLRAAGIQIGAASAPAVPAASAAARLAPKPAARNEDGIRWQALTPEQRHALAPLEGEWPKIEAARKQKWLVLAARFRAMPPEEQARISDRMAEWARLTPAERGQARLRFQESKELPVSDRKERWQAYQALPPDARQKLVARAASAASASKAPNDGRRADSVATRSGASGAASQAQAKANTVPNPATGQPPRAVAPTLVQAAPGATTTSITRRPMPPAHQQSGMPKIAATPEFVSRATLLPRRGPQAVGIASAPVVRPTIVLLRPPGAASAPFGAAPSATAPANPSPTLPPRQP